MNMDNLLICVLTYAWLEYLVHRFDMHKVGSLRFQSHTIEHHGKLMMGPNQANLTQSDVAIVFWFSLPITFLMFLFFDQTFPLYWVVFLFWAGFAWTAVHRNIHGEKGYWYAWILCPWLPIVKWNHLRHHNNPKCGYGGMFWFLTDTVMGTV